MRSIPVGKPLLFSHINISDADTNHFVMCRMRQVYEEVYTY